MNGHLEVYEYTIDKLREILAEKSNNSLETISRKLHLQYFQGYCDTISVRTIVVENKYVDQHYLEDYAAYYVRCFHPYERFCTRVHLFQEAFTQEEFEKYVAGITDRVPFKKMLSDNYLGFVVVKPLPQTVVGRTCLATYPEENRRHFPIVRTYEVNLFGTPLKVRSLAYQEQDRVVAACATSALWSLFQGTGKEFQHIIPSPVEITRAATEKSPIETRVLPSRGLSTAMMAHAIRHVGLEPDLVNVEDDYVLKTTAYAYLRGKMPMILGIELWDTSNTPNDMMGFHAVAVTGFSLGNEEPTPYGDTDFQLRASKIDKIYVHDDQVGPFARMEFDNIPVTSFVDTATNEEHHVSSISSSWVGINEEIGSVRAHARILLIPVYHKIRIPFSSIHDTVIAFDSFFDLVKGLYEDGDFGKLEWDIYLTTNNSVKSELHNIDTLDDEYLCEILFDGLPKFIWRATALLNDEKAIDLLFDATDIEQGTYFLRAIEYNEDLSLFLRVISRASHIERVFNGNRSWGIIEWFKNQAVPGLD